MPFSGAIRGGAGLLGAGALLGSQEAEASKAELLTWLFGRLNRRNDMGFNLELFHGTRSPEDFDQFEVGLPRDEFTGELLVPYNKDPGTLLGPHFATDPSISNKFVAADERDMPGWLRASGRQGPRRNIPVVARGNILKVDDEQKIHAMFHDYAPPLEEAIDDVANQWGLRDEIEEGIRNDYHRFADDFAHMTPEEIDEAIEFETNAELFLIYSGKTTRVEGDDFAVEVDQIRADAVSAALQARGIDGIRYRNRLEGGEGVVMLDPEKNVRSVNARFEKERGDLLSGGAPMLGPLAGNVPESVQKDMAERPTALGDFMRALHPSRVPVKIQDIPWRRAPELLVDLLDDSESAY